MPPGLASKSISTDPVGLAPRWHTAALVGLIVAVAATGAALPRGSGMPAQPTSVVAIHLSIIVVQWCLLAYVCRVARPPGTLGALLGARWRTAARLPVDLVLAGAGWLLVLTIERVWRMLFGTGHGTSVAAMLPHSAIEHVTWVLVSVSAGFCEEIVYRGYLQTQLTAFDGRAGVGIVLQAVLFGLAHGDQGPGAAVRLAIYGLAFGALARWRRSLIPGIACHTWTNLASGLFRL